MLLPIPPRELIDEHGAQGLPARITQPPGRHLDVHIEDALELFVEMFNRMRAQFMPDATHSDPAIQVWVGTTGRGDHHVVRLGTGQRQGPSHGRAGRPVQSASRPGALAIASARVHCRLRVQRSGRPPEESNRPPQS